MARNDIDLGMSIEKIFENINQTTSTTNSNNSTLRRIMLGKVAIPELTIGETTEEDSTAKTKIKYKKNSDGTESIAIEGKSFDIENQIKIGEHGRITNYSGDDTYTEIRDDSELWLISENEDGQLSYIDIFPEKINYYSPNHSFKGNVDFTNATVTGLNLGGGGGSSGGTLPIEVDELPTQNIDDSKIYVLNKIETEVFFHYIEGYMTLEQLISASIPTATAKYYVVDDFPAEPLVTNLETLNPAHCYILNNIPYLYCDPGTGNTWVPVNMILSAVMDGMTIENKGATNDITKETEMGLYVQGGIMPEIYYLTAEGYNTLKEVVSTIIESEATVKYHIVDELPTDPQILNTNVFNPVHCYIYNDIPYVYVNSADNLVELSTLFTQLGTTTVLYKGVTDNIDEETEEGLYLAYLENEPKRGFYLHSKGKFLQINEDITSKNLTFSGSNVFSAINMFNDQTNFNGRTSFLNGVWFGDPDDIIRPDVRFFCNSVYFMKTGINMGDVSFSTKVTFSDEVDFSGATVTGLPEPDTSNIVTLDTEQTISGKKTFNGIKIGNANIEWNESGFKELDIKIDEGNGALVFRADDVSLLSNNDIMIERGGLSAVNVSSSGIYIYDENVDTGNCANISFEDGIISLSSDNKIDFSGKVDFSNATVTGLPNGGGGLDIPSEVISYDSTNNSLSFNTKTLNFNASDSIRIENNLNWFYFEDTERQSQFGLKLADQTVMFNITYEKENDTSSFYCDANIIDFTQSQKVKVSNELIIGSRGARLSEIGYLEIADPDNIYLCVESGYGSYIDIYGDDINYDAPQHNFSGTVNFGGTVNFNNGLTLNGSLTLANGSGEIYSSEENLRISTNAPASLEISTEDGGEILINNDNTKIESYNGLNLFGNEVVLYANNSINIVAGENDDTSFYISPSGMDVTANNGNINFTTNNQGRISFSANGNESSSGINLYDTVIKYNAAAHQFFGEVDFSDATVTGLPSSGGSSDLTELKRVMRLLHTEKYTQSIQATKFTSTPMGSIHKIEKPSNDLLEASEYVLYSVDFEDASAYLNATITIGNNGLINDSGTFSFTLQGSSITAGQNINVICVFVPSAFL